MAPRLAFVRFVVFGAALGAPLSAQTAVHVVDQAGGPGAEFASFSQAIAAANDGDLLLVRSGTYPEEVLLDGLGLSLVADTGAEVRVFDVSVRALPPGGLVLVRGLELEPDPNVLLFGNFSARVETSSGRVRFEDCHFASLPVLPGFPISGGVLLEQSDHTVLSACSVDPPQGSGPIHGIHARNATAFVFDSLVLGAAVGTAAVQVTDGALWFAGSTAAGGDGIDGASIFCSSQNGGDGLVVSGASAVELLDATLSGGAAGQPCGEPGEPLVVESGSVTTTPGSAHALVFSEPAREGDPVTATVSGAAGDRVWLSISPEPGGPLRRRQWDGPLLLQTPIQSVPAGTIGASGSLVVNGIAPDLPTGVEFDTWWGQAFVLSGSTGRFVVSAPATLVVLDASL